MDDHSKKAVDLTQGVAKQLISLAAAIVVFSVVFADRFNRQDNPWMLPAASAAFVLSIVIGVWTLLSLAGALRAAAAAGAAKPWVVGGNVRLPLILQALLFIGGVGMLASGSAVGAPQIIAKPEPATASVSFDQLAQRLDQVEGRLAQSQPLAARPVEAPATPTDTSGVAIDKLSGEVERLGQALIEQTAALAKQQQVVSAEAARQHTADVARAANRAECEAVGSILGSLRPIMNASLAGPDAGDYQQFWTLYSGPFLLVRSPELIKGVEECAALVGQIENGPVLNSDLQAKLKQKAGQLAKQCRSRFRDSTPTAEVVGAN